MSNIIGLTICGYRYGKANESGKSWNFREEKNECGISMAKVGYMDEMNSFAVDEYSQLKKHYYVGTVAGYGGDDEICLVDVKELSYREYLKSLKETKEANNIIVNDICDTKIGLLKAGWNLGRWTIESVESWRASCSK